MWELYDELIEPIPDDLKVDEILVGNVWTMVRAGERLGVAMTTKGQTREPICKESRVGMSLRCAACLIKSWNLIEASIGAAAINAYYNTVENLKQLNAGGGDVFSESVEKVRGKRVAVIGHFSNIRQYLEAAAEVSILERSPQLGDYPDSACEYILPGQDFVFITGCTLINKTMPRLLELSHGARVIITGPSVPLTPIMFEYGATELGGLVITDISNVRSRIAEGNNGSLFSWGERFHFTK